MWVDRPKRAIAWVLLVACLVLAAVLFGAPDSAPGALVTVAGAKVIVGGADVVRVDVTAGEHPCDQCLTQDSLAPESAAAIRFARAGAFTINVVHVDGRQAKVSVRVLRPKSLYIMMVLLAASIFLGPYALASSSTGSPWVELVSEPAGGMSLGRLQLLLWFAPTVVLWGGMSFLTHTFAPIDGQVALLLGLSGGTTFLGSAANPPSENGPRVTPELGDLVQDWNGNPDVSRYQYLAISAIGASTLLVGFLQNMEFPALPPQLLYLLAASQGTYIATKAVKASTSTPKDARAGLDVLAVRDTVPTKPAAPPLDAGGGA
jgi:hypothetical protein